MQIEALAGVSNIWLWENRELCQLLIGTSLGIDGIFVDY
jgi:hypothetical protein